LGADFFVDDFFVDGFRGADVFVADERLAGFLAFPFPALPPFPAVVRFLLVTLERDEGAFCVVGSDTASNPPSSAIAPSTESTMSKVRVLLSPTRFAKAATNSSFMTRSPSSAGHDIAVSFCGVTRVCAE
jgi:hypothetical protein